MSNEYRITSGPFASAWKVCVGLGVVGLGASLAGLGVDAKRFAFSYLFAFAVFLTLAIGATFFVLMQHVTNAGWSVSVRRIAEFFMSALPVFALLFLPIALNTGNLFPWWGDHHAPAAHHAPANGNPATHEPTGHADTTAPEPQHGAAAAATDELTHPAQGHGPAHHVAGHRLTQGEIDHHLHAEVLASKTWYLSVGFFFARALAYFLIWGFISWRLFKNSTDQDKTRSPTETAKSQALAPAATVLMALTTTFAAFDWLMSLLPTWYSTIFGVWIFSGAMVVGLAVITLVAYALRASGASGKAITTEHFHDLGKLLFGFNVFWAYISFSQFFLIWYASIPEETSFFHIRWGNGPWVGVSLSILFLHFLVPFLLLLSRNTKRYFGQKALMAGAALLLVMHVVEMYWLVMPNLAEQRGISAGASEALSLHWLDLTCLLGVGGVYLAAVFYRMATNPTVPLGDPRLGRSVHLDNA